MDNHQNQQNDAQPTPEQINTAKDGVTLARLVLADERNAAADLIRSFLNDPRSLPGVLFGLCGLIAEALPQDVDPEVFFQGVYTRLDGLAEAGPAC